MANPMTNLLLRLSIKIIFLALLQWVIVFVVFVSFGLFLHLLMLFLKLLISFDLLLFFKIFLRLMVNKLDCQFILPFSQPFKITHSLNGLDFILIVFNFCLYFLQFQIIFRSLWSHLSPRLIDLLFQLLQSRRRVYPWLYLSIEFLSDFNLLGLVADD